METREQADSGSSSDNSNMTSLWKVLWGLQIPNKVKHFAWRVCKNILPTLSNLKRRGIVENDLCEECRMGCESSGHVCWSCFCASNTWALTSIFCRQQHMYFNDFMELFWFLVHVQRSDNDVLSLAVTIAWALWTRQNEKRHGGKFMTGLELVNWCGRYIDSYKAANSADAASSPSAAPNSADSASSAIAAPSALVSATHCRQVWSPPAGSVFKVNGDGAVFAQQRKSGLEW